MATINCKHCKNILQAREFYKHPRHKKPIDICKQCLNKTLNNEILMIDFCREYNIYFDKNLWERSINKATDNKYVAKYFLFLNLNKGSHKNKTFDDSIYDIPDSIKDFHESKRFEQRQSDHYCRTCGKMLEANNFYSTSTPQIDKNGLLSI